MTEKIGMLNARLAARIAKIDQDSIRRAIREGRLEAVKSRGRWVMRMSEVRRYMARRGKQGMG